MPDPHSTAGPLKLNIIKTEFSQVMKQTHPSMLWTPSTNGTIYFTECCPFLIEFPYQPLSSVVGSAGSKHCLGQETDLFASNMAPNNNL